jgi:hypothetical protein
MFWLRGRGRRGILIPDCSEFNVSLHDEILERYGSAFNHLLPHYAKTYTFEKTAAP